MRRHLLGPLRLTPLRVAALAPLCVALGCGGAAEPEDGAAGDGGEPPHIVLVLIDTLRADHTSLYGYERPTTPHMERIAEAIAKLGHTVEDLGNLAPKDSTVAEPANPLVHKLAENVGWTHTLMDAAQETAQRGMPIFLGGDHALAAGSVAGMAAHAQ